MYPDHVVLGEHETAEVRVKVYSSSGSMDCEKIRIHSNTGELSELIRTGHGVYRSTLKTPGSFFPRFALIAAVGTCGGVPTEGHTVVPLFGSGEVEVKAKPYTEVTLKIADESFGPKRTNERGKASIPIIAPPGHMFGTVGDKKVDLKLPPVNRIVAIADRTEIMAGDEGRTIIWIFAINQKGDPLTNGDIELAVDKGRTTQAEAISAGVYRSFYSGPKVIGNQAGTINVSINGDTASTDNVQFDFKPGKPAKIQIETAMPFFRAGETQSIPVTVAVADQYGNPTGRPVTLNTDFGDTTPLIREENGSFKTTLTVPDKFEARDSLVFSATGDTDSGTISLKQEFPLEAGEPSTIKIEKPSFDIPADGKTSHFVGIRVLDKFGNPVSGESLSLSASQGAVPSTVTTKKETIVPYTPPLHLDTDECQLNVSAKDLSQTATLSLTSRTYLLAVTPRIGYIFNAGNLSSFHSNLSLDQNLWFLLTGLHVGLEISHHYSNAEQESEQIEWSFHNIGIHGFLGYRYWFLPNLYASINAAVGTHISINRMSHPDEYELVESAAQVSYQFEAEAGYKLGPGSVAFQFGFGVSKPSKIARLSGNTNGVIFMLGYRLELL